jgi:hypothetical protein
MTFAMSVISGYGHAESLSEPAPPGAGTVSAADSVIERPASTAPTIEVPEGDPATIDGVFSSAEWSRALKTELTGGQELRLMHSGGYLYLGISSRAMGYGSICLSQNGKVSILHSSAALGTAAYERDSDSWRRTRRFSWCCRSHAPSAERDEHLRREAWMASIGYMGTADEMEYQIAMDAGNLTLAVVYQEGSDLDSALWWPEGLEDDCLGLVLLGGDPPETLQFSPEKWVTVVASPD